ncbi:hypothetical protein [Algoriphagus sp. NG3]|uniref:hypothetical protein n=1 Tax=Algoriphagus sp. NG3 TaxID=3097546 RepID=UPI002A7EBD9B|nr:hypothetical protein [Algoriphagus sp. NG3]WPR75499.1 hypothetical protein SLW71_22840 [Algoriphagus sp. NG3]
MEEQQLASGKQENELFLGLELGMGKKLFYEKCWQMNNEGILTNGPSELSVEYQVQMPSSLSTKMRFYPKFQDEKIYAMPVDYIYEGWAPWNEELSAEKLRSDVLKLYEDWFGPGFIEVKSEDGNQLVFVKIDGNRRTRIFKKNISTVRVEIVDLPILKNLQANQK